MATTSTAVEESGYLGQIPCLTFWEKNHSTYFGAQAGHLFLPHLLPTPQSSRLWILLPYSLSFPTAMVVILVLVLPRLGTAKPPSF